MRRAGILLLLFSLVAPGAAEAAVTVGASLDRTKVRVGDQVQMTLTIEGDIDKFEEPVVGNLGPFQVYRRGSSQSFRFVQGQRSASVSFTYLLIPNQAGHHTIPSIEVVADGRTYRSVPVELEVVTADQPRPEEPAPPGLRQGEVDPSGDYFVTLTVDKEDVVLGEQVLLTFAFYRATRRSLFDSPEYTPPTTEGFWREDLPARQPYDRVVRSRRFVVQERSYALFPTQTGELTIGEAVVRLAEDRFGSLLRRRQPRGDRFLRAPAITINVRPLPPDAPAGFEGTVGEDLDLEVSVDRSELAAGDALTLTLSLEGNGYLGSAKRPEVQIGDTFRVHDAGSAIDSRPVGGKLRGRLTVDKLLIPTEPGPSEIPGQSYVYFDTRREEYRTLSTRPIALNVLPSDAPTAAVFAGGGRGEIELLSQDILHIKPITGALAPAAVPLPQRAAFWTVLSLPGLAWLASGLLARRRRSQLADPDRIRRSRALKSARYVLQGSGGAANRSAQAIHTFVGAKAGREPAGLTSSFIQEWMADHSVPENLRGRVAGILERCDQLRFAPGAGGGDALLQETDEVLRALDGELS